MEATSSSLTDRGRGDPIYIIYIYMGSPLSRMSQRSDQLTNMSFRLTQCKSGLFRSAGSMEMDFCASTLSKYSDPSPSSSMRTGLNLTTRSVIVIIILYYGEWLHSSAHVSVAWVKIPPPPGRRGTRYRSRLEGWGKDAAAAWEEGDKELWSDKLHGCGFLYENQRKSYKTPPPLGRREICVHLSNLLGAYRYYIGCLPASGDAWVYVFD